MFSIRLWAGKFGLICLPILSISEIEINFGFRDEQVCAFAALKFVETCFRRLGASPHGREEFLLGISIIDIFAWIDDQSARALSIPAVLSAQARKCVGRWPVGGARRPIRIPAWPAATAGRPAGRLFQLYVFIYYFVSM